MIASYLIGYFLPLILCLLVLGLLFMTDIKAYIIHIIIGIFAFIPILNWLTVVAALILILLLIADGNFNGCIKPNKLTKFLFGKDEEN